MDAAANPKGMARIIPMKLAAKAICTLSTTPRIKRPERLKSGGTMRASMSPDRGRPWAVRTQSMLSVLDDQTR